ncbi:MAG: SGNH/GDSL hydrolase family protein [Magnetococcales bacterium]|nr:SGNH/GDSL hydrolase family protein [Magnetococcales bacterium]
MLNEFEGKEIVAKPSKGKKIIFFILLFFIISVTPIALYFLAAELYWLVQNPDEEFNRKFVTVNDSPFLTKMAPNQDATTYPMIGAFHYNNVGVRKERDIKAIPDDNIYRILMYGDSVTHGFMMHENQHYPFLVEQLLNEKLPKSVTYETLNMSRGSSPAIYSHHLRVDLPALRPKMVVVQIELSNDLADELGMMEEGRDEDDLSSKITHYRYFLSGRAGMSTIPMFGIPWLETRMSFVTLARRIGWLRSTYGNYKPPPYYLYMLGFDNYLRTTENINTTYNRMFEIIQGMKTYSNKNGANFLLIITPSRNAYDNNPEDPIGFHKPGARHLLQMAEKHATLLSIPFISLYEEFGQFGGADLFTDFCHPTVDGQQLIAFKTFMKIAEVITGVKQSLTIQKK